MRLLATIAMGTALTLSILAVPALAADRDSVVGEASTNAADPRTWSVDASSNTDGSNPSGTMSYRDRYLSWNLTVNCLQVVANRAAVQGFATDGSGSFLIVHAEFVDEPGGQPDRVGWEFLLTNGPPGATPPPSCAVGRPDSALEPTFSGGFTVVDGSPPPPPLPTSKDQCKNGGWKTFGVFKNQGDCVSSVATGGENPPASES